MQRHPKRERFGVRPFESRRRRVARKTVSVLPTLFTLGNLLCGFAAIFIVSRGDAPLPFGWSAPTAAALLIFLGMALDGVDGGIARLTRSASELGEQLDSMADMVTFGVAPAFVAIQLIGVGLPFLSEAAEMDTFFSRLAFMVACIFVVCAALRLARFNVELDTPGEHDHNFFRGLPAPGAAGTVVAMVLLHEHFFYGLADWGNAAAMLTRFAMVGIMLLVAIAMVSNFRYAHVVNRYIRGRAGVDKIALVIAVALLLLVHWQGALALGFALYALSAPCFAFYRRARQRTAPPAGHA